MENRSEIEAFLRSEGWSRKEIRKFFKSFRLEDKLKNGNREKARKEALKFLSASSEES